jgi:hypothetical protein
MGIIPDCGMIPIFMGKLFHLKMTFHTRQKTRKIYLFAIFALIMISFLSFEKTAMVRKAFLISPSSKLYINGSSNINKFTCNCIENFGKHYFNIEANAGDRVVHFRNTALKLTTNRLNCGHKGINKDLYEALKADKHPHISIVLNRAVQQPDAMLADAQDWIDLKANAVITIANVAKELELDVRARRIEGNKYQFVSSKNLKMSDFNITPPQPMFGLIKVHDQISINLDLTLTIVDN